MPHLKTVVSYDAIEIARSADALLKAIVKRNEIFRGGLVGRHRWELKMLDDRGRWTRVTPSILRTYINEHFAFAYKGECIPVPRGLAAIVFAIADRFPAVPR